MNKLNGCKTERFARLNHRDSETGLDPTHFRMYSSGVGRWQSPDALRGSVFNPQSLNRYSYVLGNPANRIDPRGLCGCYPGYDEFDYLLDFGFVPDYGNYGCGCSPFGCGYPLLPPIGVVVFGGGGGGVAAGGVDPSGLDYCATPIWDDQGNLIGYDPNSCVPDNQYYGQFGYAYVEPQIVNPGAPPTSNSGFWTSLMGSWLVGTMTPSPSWAPNPSYRGGVIRSAPPTTTQVGPNLTPSPPPPSGKYSDYLACVASEGILQAFGGENGEQTAFFNIAPFFAAGTGNVPLVFVTGGMMAVYDPKLAWTVHETCMEEVYRYP